MKLGNLVEASKGHKILPASHYACRVAIFFPWWSRLEIPNECLAHTQSSRPIHAIFYESQSSWDVFHHLHKMYDFFRLAQVSKTSLEFF